MLIVLSHSADETANYLCRRFDEIAIGYARVDTDTCASWAHVSYDQGPGLSLPGRDVLHPEEVRNVWLRRPRAVAVPDSGDHAEQAHVSNEWSEALEGFLAHVPAAMWMNHPVNNVLASHKMEQLTRARAHGLAVPRTLVTQSPSALRAFWNETSGRVIAKPLAGGFLERSDGQHTSIYTVRVRAEQLEDPAIHRCPTLFQEEIAKAFDVRLTVIDDRITAVALYRDDKSEPDVRRDNMSGVRYEVISVPGEIDAALRRLLRSYSLRFAAVDFGVATDGSWVFFEINPNGQWAWMDVLGITTLWKDFAHAFAA